MQNFQRAQLSLCYVLKRMTGISIILTRSIGRGTSSHTGVMNTLSSKTNRRSLRQLVDITLKYHWPRDRCEQLKIGIPIRLILLTSLLVSSSLLSLMFLSPFLLSLQYYSSKIAHTTTVAGMTLLLLLLFSLSPLSPSLLLVCSLPQASYLQPGLDKASISRNGV